ncbi:hypothetical protein Q1695_015873 [Nippostrongylus brasiliensis]|nr:hypothetical protein Q1695_015873 [Nippostrongylus brasiliensis]
MDRLVDSAMEIDRKDRRMEDPTAPRVVTGLNVQGEATEAIPTGLRVETVHKDPAIMDRAMRIDHKDRLMKEAAVGDPIALRVGSGLNVLHSGEAMEALLTVLGVETVHKDPAVMDPATGIDRKDRRMEETAVEDPTVPRAVTGLNVQGEATEAVPTAPGVETVHKDRQMEEAPGTDPAVLTVDIGHNVLPLRKTKEVDLSALRVEDFLEIPMDEAVPNFQTQPNRRAALLAETVHKDRAVMDPAMGTDHKDRLTKEAATEDLIALRVGSGLNVLHLGGAMEVLLTALGVETVHKDRTVMDPVM